MLTRELVLNSMGSTAADTLDVGALLTCVGAQDKLAFGELCRRFQQSAYNLAFSVLHDASLAEDAVQNAMLSIWVSAKKYDASRGNASAWIYGIVMNHSYKLAQSVKRRERYRYEEQIAMKGRTLDSTAGEATEHNEALAVLRAHLARLPELERTLLACLFGASMTHEKIAQMMGMPRRTVTDKINQVLARLRVDLGKAGVASVGTLMSSESLFKAMAVGRPCPTGMAERVLERVESVSARVRRYPRHRKMNVSRGSNLMPAGLAGVACVVTLAVLAAKSGPSTAKAPITPPAPLAQSAPAAAPAPVPIPVLATPAASEADVDLKWDLSNGIPGDFRQVQGACSPSVKTGFPGIQVASADDAAFIVQHKIPARPLHVAVNGYFMTGRVVSTGCYWCDGYKLLACNIIKRINGLNLESKTFTQEFWIFDNYIVSANGSDINAYSRYSAPFPSNEFCLSLGHNAVYRSIEVKTIAESDIPASVRNVEEFRRVNRVQSSDMPESDLSQEMPDEARRRQ